MPPQSKDKRKEENEPKTHKKSCGVNSPGPKYKLRTLVGYEEHCQSRIRNPAYSIAFKQTGNVIGCGPGPKYLVASSKKPGFTFGYRWTSTAPKCSPGPYYYKIPPCTPKFSMKWRTPYRSGCVSPGPYNIVDKTPGPAFTFGKRPSGATAKCSPGPYAPPRIDLIKPGIPAYSIRFKQTSNDVCDGPGPKYLPILPRKPPMYSFGTRHSECSPHYCFGVKVLEEKLKFPV